MAQKKSTTTKKTASKPRQSAKKAPAKVETPQPPQKSGFADYFHAFSKTRFFKPVVYAVIVFALIGIDLLIAWNKFDTFFAILGIEIIVFAVFLAIRLAMSSNKEPVAETKDNDYAP